MIVTKKNANCEGKGNKIETPAKCKRTINKQQTSERYLTYPQIPTKPPDFKFSNFEPLIRQKSFDPVACPNPKFIIPKVKLEKTVDVKTHYKSKDNVPFFRRNTRNKVNIFAAVFDCLLHVRAAVKDKHRLVSCRPACLWTYCSIADATKADKSGSTSSSELFADGCLSSDSTSDSSFIDVKGIVSEDGSTSGLEIFVDGYSSVSYTIEETDTASGYTEADDAMSANGI